MQSRLLLLSQFYIQSYRGLSTTCWRGLILSLLESTCVSTFYFLSIYFVNDLQMSIATAGTIISAYGFGAIAGGYVGGKLSDLSSPTKIMTMSLSIQAVCYLLFTKLHSVSLLFANVILLGMASYAFLTANYLWVLDQCRLEAERFKALNMLSMFSNLGFGISGMLIGAAASYGFHTIFFTTGVLLASLAVYIGFIDNKKNQEFSHQAEESARHSVEMENRKPNHLTVIMALISVLFIGSIVAQLSSGYAIYINEIFKEMGMSAVSILFTLNALIVVFFATPIGQHINQYNKLTMLSISCFLIGFGMCMLSFSSLFSMAILACIIYTVGEIIYFSLVQLVCYEAGEKKAKGKSLGRYRVVYGASRVVGPFVGTAIYHHFSGEMLWYVCGLVGTLCMLGFWSVKEWNNN